MPLLTIDSEIILLGDPVADCITIKYMLNDLKIPFVVIKTFEDNRNCIKFTSKNSKKSKPLEMKYFFVCDLVRERTLNIKSIDIQDQMNYMFAKALGKNKI